MFDKIEHFKAYDELLKAARTMEGINFALAMRQDDEIKVYRREDQPCQGGEMRKYGISHLGDSTRPKDRRPQDLRHPFPEGIPEAVAVHLNIGSQQDIVPFVKALYSDDSPYKRGFGSAEDVEFVLRGSGDALAGLIFWNTEIDPTVFVNSLQFLNTHRGNGSATLFDEYTEAGLTTTEALALMILSQTNPFKYGVGNPGTYYFPARPSVRRLLEKNPHDLSGGTLRDRFDYNRPVIQTLFAAGKGEKSIVFCEELTKRGVILTEKVTKESPYNGRSYTIEQAVKQSPDAYIPIVKEILADAVKESADEDHTIVHEIEGLDLNRGKDQAIFVSEYDYEIGQFPTQWNGSKMYKKAVKEAKTKGYGCSDPNCTMCYGDKVAMVVSTNGEFAVIDTEAELLAEKVQKKAASAKAAPIKSKLPAPAAKGKAAPKSQKKGAK